VGGGPGLSTFYAQPADTATATVQAVVDTIRDFWTTLNPRIMTGNSWTVSGVVDVIDAATGLITSRVIVVSRTGAGSESGDQLPPMAQGLVRLQTGVFRNGRQIVGHLNIPAPGETDSTVQGAPNATYLTAVQGAANTLAAITATAWSVYSRRNHLAVAPVTPAAQGFWAVLRSRRS
jgi:hypothetical protein